MRLLERLKKERCAMHTLRAGSMNLRQNPNIETQNPRQIQMTEIPMSQTMRRGMSVLNFEPLKIRACFGFRDSDFGFCISGTTPGNKLSRFG
jgi:hypothetical protein